jgi:hypothetical protein
MPTLKQLDVLPAMLLCLSEEAYRILTDEKQNGHLVLLDAKAAFDKVIHPHLFRRMYHAGIQDKTWTVDCYTFLWL